MFTEYIEPFLHIAQWSLLEQILFGVVILLFLYIAVWYLFMFNKKSFLSHKTNSEIEQKPISVIIAAKNEAENLKKLIPLLLEQDYSTFEIFIVNDCSWDKTQDVLIHFKEKYPDKINISKTVNEEYEGNFSGKKLALTIGIKGSKYQNLAFIDADCWPNTNNWLKEINKGLAENDMLLLYGAYKKEKGFLNTLIRVETYIIALLYSTSAKFNNAYMGVGRNLAYKKELFFKLNGFKSHLNIPSGDDDLFIQQYAKSKKPKIGTLLSKEAKTISIPEKSWSKWFYQKRRHFVTADLYSNFTLLKLGVFDVFTILLFVSPLIYFISDVFLNPIFWIVHVFVFLIYFIKNYILLKFLSEKIFFLWIPFLSVCVILFRLFVGITNWMQKPKNWNGK